MQDFKPNKNTTNHNTILNNMKPIQIIITFLMLAYASVNLIAQNNNDTVRVTYKGKGVTVRPQGEESTTTVKFKDTLTGKEILVKVAFQDLDLEDTSDRKTFKFMPNLPNKKEDRKFIETKFLPNFDLGFVSTMNEVDNTNSFDPKLNKSANINLGIIEQEMNLYKGRVLLSYGLSSNNYYLKYSNKQMLQTLDNNGYLVSQMDTINNYDKNRLNIHYLTVPVLLEYHSKGDKFNVAAGVEFSFNGNTNLTTKGDRESLEFKRNEDVNIKINPTQMNAILRIGYDHLAIYARYSISDMYKSSAYAPNTNPHQHLFSVGVCLFGI